MEFPSRETDIVRLAHDIAGGIRTNPELFPTPPISAEQLDAAVAGYFAKRDVAVASTANARQGTVDKASALEALELQCRSVLRYAEGLVPRDDQKLHLVGWG